MSTSKNEKVRAQTVVYTVGNGLYVNITNACTNRCDFCIRNNGDGAYGSSSLWLEREPTLDEITDAISAKDPTGYSEVVFCGYGEPTCRLDRLLDAARFIKNNYPTVPVRLNTNGQADLIAGKSTASLFSGLFDVISISLNAPDSEGYDAVCHSVYGKAAFDAVLDFARAVKEYVPECVFSVVGDFLTAEQIDRSERIAAECGIALRVRKYIAP
jgi:TatD family-associated radical SAM protein